MSSRNHAPAAPDPDLPDVLALKSGDERALERLMEKHDRILFRTILRSINNQWSARELVQDVFTKAYFSISQFSGQGSFKAWLYRIALNSVRDAVKSRALRESAQTDSMSETTGYEGEYAEGDEPPALVTHRTPGEDAQSTEALNSLRSGIARLPDELRMPFILCVLEEHSHEEAATILGLTPKAIEMRIYKARKRLEKDLAHLLHDR